MEKNKTGKYFKYAFGEIILVVIGILIALQLNNWNEEVKIHKKQETHLRSIRQEMTNNLKTVRREKEFALSVIESDRQIVNIIDVQATLDTINDITMHQLISKSLFNQPNVHYENGVLSELISSGGLKDIENEKIRKILASWESKIGPSKYQEEIIAKTSNDIFDYYDSKGLRARTLFDQVGYSKAKLGIGKSSKKTKNDFNILANNQAENLLLRHLSFVNKLHKDLYPELEHHLEAIIQLIDEELNEK